jgi:hypothetical protein
MPDAHESCRQYARLATHMLSVNCLYQMNEKKRKGEFEKCGSLPKWFREAREIWTVVTSVTAFWAVLCGK